MADQIEVSLQEIAGKLREAWTNNRCTACPLGELSALAAATLTFYQEWKRMYPLPPTPEHWSTKWRSQRG